MGSKVPGSHRMTGLLPRGGVSQMGNGSVGVTYALTTDAAPFAPCPRQSSPRPCAAGTGTVPTSDGSTEAHREQRTESGVWSQGSGGQSPLSCLQLVTSASGSA